MEDATGAYARVAAERDEDRKEKTMSDADERGKRDTVDSTNDSTQARKRIERRWKLQGDILAYIVINAFLIVVWAVTGRGYFWPGWVLCGWAVFLFLDVLSFVHGPITQADIDAELGRMQSQR